MIDDHCLRQEADKICVELKHLDQLEDVLDEAWGEFEMVGDEEHGHPVVGRRYVQLQNFHFVAHVEACRRFIQEQHIGLLCECPSHPGSLDLTTG